MKKQNKHFVLPGLRGLWPLDPDARWVPMRSGLMIFSQRPKAAPNRCKLNNLTFICLDNCSLKTSKRNDKIRFTGVHWQMYFPKNQVLNIAATTL